MASVETTMIYTHVLNRGPHGILSPADKVYTLTNLGATNLDWAAGETSDWLDVDPVAGTLGSGASTNVTVLVARIILRQDGLSSQTIAYNNAVEAILKHRGAVG